MSNVKQSCFDQSQLDRFLSSQSDAVEEAQIEAHIASCDSCQTSLEKLAGHQEVWSEIRDHLADDALHSPGEETREHLETQDRERDLQKIQKLLGPTDDPEMIGRIGSFEVCGMIGRGSAGVVVKALDTRLNRYVAIKLLAPAYSNNGSSRRRFEREAKAIASVKDPNVIPVHSVGEYQGTPYIVMQYVPDGSLYQRLEKQGPMKNAEVVCVAMQIAKGLAAAHKRGIVHRDVKPGNVLLESGVDCAMVTDFGLARVVDEATMTRSGAISGTPQFMSPEQAKGESVDPRSDLFSLGSVMYAMCTGHSPFRAESVFGVIKRVCDSTPRAIRETNPEISEWLEAFIEKLQSKCREDRFETADQVADLLAQELAHLQAPTMVAQPERKWWVKKEPLPQLDVQPIAEKPKKKTASKKQTTFSIPNIGLGVLLMAALATGGAFALQQFGFFNTSSERYSPLTLLEQTQQENEKLPRFDNTVETTIDVKEGGTLFLKTNLGALNVKTHDKPVVQMLMTHTVGSKDKETASKLFKAVTLKYDLDSDEVKEFEFTKEKDAVIIAKFPTQKLTEQEIADATDLEELKDQLLIRNNSHFRNAKFELLVPNEYNLNIHTSAGPITTSDIDGWVKLISHGGPIEIGNVSGTVLCQSKGGHIVAKDLAEEAVLLTEGGHIETGIVQGNLTAQTEGGHIQSLSVGGTCELKTEGGHIHLGRVSKSVNAETGAGAITVNFAGQPGGDSKLFTGAGAITIGYVDSLAFDIDANCQLGSIRAPFFEKGKKLKGFKLNDGDDKLTVISQTGSIRFYEKDKKEIDADVEHLRNSAIAEQAFQEAYELHMEGKIDEAIPKHKIAAQFEEFRGIATYNLGCAWALKGQTERAFVALNDAISFGFDDVEQFESDSDLDSLRKDERFEKMMSRIRQEDDDDFDEDVELDELDDKLQTILFRGNEKLNRHEYADAEKLFATAIKIDEENEMAKLRLGLAIHYQGRLDEAYPIFLKLTDSKRYGEFGHYNLACIHAKKEETDKAIKRLNMAIKKGFRDVKHIKLDKDLDNIRNDRRFDAIISKLTKDDELTKEDDECCSDNCDN